MESKHTNNSLNNRRYTLLKTILRLSPLSWLFGCYIIWFYLNELGWLSLFTNSLQIKSDLIASLISFAIASMAFTFIALLPSFFIMQLYLVVDQIVLRRTLKIGLIPIITLIISFMTIGFLSIIIYFSSIIPVIIKTYSFPFLLGCSIILSFILINVISIKRRKIKCHYCHSNMVSNKYKYFSKQRMITIFMVSLSGIAVYFPISLIFKFGSAYSHAGLGSALFFAIVMSFLSLFPAIVFYSSAMRKTSLSNKISTIIISSTVAFCFVLLLMPNLVIIICHGALKNIGVIEESPHIYAVSRNEYSPTMFPSPVWIHVASEDTKNFYVMGSNLFSVGDTLLLCPAFVKDTQSKTFKYNFDNPFGRDTFISKHFKALAKSCVPVKKIYINRWDTINDDGNKLNSDQYQLQLK